MSVKITYFVHGTTKDNDQDLATGWAQGELSELGKKQAKELGQQAQGMYDVVFCSDLQRAIDSADLAFGERFKIIADQRLREANYGDFTQKHTNEFKDDLVQYIDHPFPGGESYRDVEKRVSDFIELLKKSYKGKRVAIVAHQGPQLALDVLLKGKNWEQAIAEDWRHAKAWQPGWEYTVDDGI
ncbi:MAG: histidine phosphatase family protein [Candidatus Peregrinibacteria bacterium]|nr:histidine phosphatase family protein [Candidatus Peregrinibacteria bacterium]